jgi:hypothetical protein
VGSNGKGKIGDQKVCSKKRKKSREKNSVLNNYEVIEMAVFDCTFHLICTGT